ncbi:MAG: hypothetical protein K9J16_07930 [Melioribacteraceae bacterium]|nr:hypothetical protein [Melioribacteraceae bacterium]MCF8353360.1 hypothetical protein [Melioribacteraceae bacterium]MCF8393224.1 hypothetical protein [Melioribacteraceae bacterium]MCF8419086.1 hypothetical protein [Melioribacteraceae bacterium]
MRKILTVLIIVCALFEISNSQQRRYGYVDYHLDTISVNNVTGIINNYGSLEQWPGIRWKDEDILGMVFDQGLWVIGKYNEEVRIAFSQWRSSYSPGPVINEKAALLVNAEDSSRYKVYKLGKNGINKDYDKDNWPSDLGAPVNAYGYPKLYNDQMLWTVYNSVNDTVYANHWMNRNSIMKPVPLEIHQIAHARNTQETNPVLDDVLFFEWEVINKGSVSLDSAFIGFWTDIDSFNYSDTVDRSDSGAKIKSIKTTNYRDK